MNSTIDDEVVEGAKTGDAGSVFLFACDLTGLVPDKTYYIRAFARQDSKVTYSYEFNFINKPQMVFVEGNKNVPYPVQNSEGITISDFYIGKFEITNDRFCQFLNANKYNWGESYIDDKRQPWIPFLDIGNPDCMIQYNADHDYFFVKYGFENHPVVCLRQSGARVYADYSRCRLPTDAEWEYAARGGNLTQGYTYAGSSNLEEVAWYYDNSNQDTHPVGQKKPNELGLYDMTGNAGEWCLDYYPDNFAYFNNRPYQDPCLTNPLVSSMKKFIYRGANCRTGDWACGVEVRSALASGEKTKIVGIRLIYSRAELNNY
jgi:formylglycine-generating enzyme required for sulfatase activity